MENFLAFILTWGIIGYVTYFLIFPPEGSCGLSDRFNIGYVDEPSVNTVNVVVETKEENHLFKDCSEALFSLGIPKRKAKAEADLILQSNPNIKTLQEFIKEYGKLCREKKY